MPTSERRPGPTPAGGAYSIAVFMDDEGNVVEKDQATRVSVAEFNERDEQIAETLAEITPGARRQEGGLAAEIARRREGHQT